MRAGNSYIYRKGTTPNTKAAISSKVKLYSYAYGLSGWTQIGVVSNFNPSGSRTVDTVRGVGYGDQVAELVPGVSDPITFSIERTALYLANLFQVFGYRGGSDGLVRHLKHVRWPFDIKQEMVVSELETANQQDANGLVRSNDSDAGEDSQVIRTIYEGCWQTDYNYTVSSDTALISEQSSISCTDIVDGASFYNEFIASGNGVGDLNRTRLFTGQSAIANAEPGA